MRVLLQTSFDDGRTAADVCAADFSNTDKRLRFIARSVGPLLRAMVVTSGTYGDGTTVSVHVQPF